MWGLRVVCMCRMHLYVCLVVPGADSWRSLVCRRVHAGQCLLGWVGTRLAYMVGSTQSKGQQVLGGQHKQVANKMVEVVPGGVHSSLTKTATPTCP